MEEGNYHFLLMMHYKAKILDWIMIKLKKLFLLKKLMLQNKNKMNNKKNKMISLNKNICEGRGEVVVFVNVLRLSNINGSIVKIAA